MGGPTEDRLRRNLDEYKKVSVYPPWSRPFDDGTKYLLAWNKPATSDLPMDDTPGKETTYHFDADRANVAYGQAITSWIEVWKNGDPQKKLPIDVEDAWVMGDVGPEDRAPGEALAITTTARTATRSPATGAIRIASCRRSCRSSSRRRRCTCRRR